MNKSMKRWMLLFVAMVFMAAFPVDYEWQGTGTDDPTDKTKYTLRDTGETATSLPSGSSDVLYCANGTVWRITDANIGTFANVGKIVGAANGQAVVEIDIANDATMSSMFALAAGRSYFPTVVKKGGGTLSLTSTGAADLLDSTGRHFEFNADWKIENGTVKFPQNAENGKSHFWRNAEVGDSGTLVLFGNGAISQCSTISGSGLITNLFSSTSRLTVTAGPSEFSGRIQGKISLSLYGDLRLTGTQNNCSVYGIYNYGDNSAIDGRGTLGLKIIGNKNEDASIGANVATIELGSSGSGRLLVLGDALQSTDRAIQISNSSTAPATLDGGAYGGVTFNGALSLKSDTDASVQMQRVALSGSNVVECVLAGSTPAASRNGTNYTFHLTKAGTGIWRLASNADRKMSGGIAVEDGTLRFDSIGEFGDVCSLGTAKMLRDPYTGPVDDELHPPVSHAFLVGGGDSAEKEGTFEYTGGSNATCVTRPMAISGRARLRNAGTDRFRFCNVSSIGASGGVLALDGEGSANRLGNICDGEGAGPLGIVKEGSGTWTIGGDLAFSGGITVSNGTLVVENGRPFSWYRYTLKESWAVISNIVNNAKTQAMGEFGLFDGNGVRHNHSFTMGAKDQVGENAGTLDPGQVAYGMPVSRVVTNSTYSAYTPVNLCDNSRSTFWNVNGAKAYTPKDQTTWLSLVFRMTNGTPPIVAFDWLMGVNKKSSWFTCPRIFSMFASSDGVFWSEVYTATNAPLPVLDDSPYWWHGSNVWGRATTSANPCPFDRTEPYRLTNAMAVAMYSGGALRVENEPILIDALTADASGNGWALDNVAFAKDGVLNVVNAAVGSSMTLPGMFSATEGLENISGWGVALNGGRISTKYKARVWNGRIEIVTCGLKVMIR